MDSDVKFENIQEFKYFLIQLNEMIGCESTTKYEEEFELEKFIDNLVMNNRSLFNLVKSNVSYIGDYTNIINISYTTVENPDDIKMLFSCIEYC